MPRVEIYTSPFCGFCHRAKRLLEDKHVEYTEIDVMMNPERRREMEARAGRHTVPQIFIDDRHIGGCDDLFALERRGDLDPLLSGGTGSGAAESGVAP